MGKVDRVSSLNRATEFLAEIDHALIDNDVRRGLLDEDLQRRLEESVFPVVEDGNGPGQRYGPTHGPLDSLIPHYLPCPHDDDCHPRHDKWVCVDGSYGNGASYHLTEGKMFGPDDPFAWAVWSASGFFTGMAGESPGMVSANHAVKNLDMFPDLYGDGMWGRSKDEWWDRQADLLNVPW